MAFIILVIFLLTGWTARITSEFAPDVGVSLWPHLIVIIAAIGLVLIFRRLAYGKLHIKQFSTGSATVTLDDKSVSYFDQYLDEIVYFFAISKCDIVIFEDIDRFNDSHIFETLRALNTLLNASPQIKRAIRFIYAIKDSIFDRIRLEAEGRKVEILETDDPAMADAMCANRTKFFDLVIPVVPFITHSNARDLVQQLFGKIEHHIDQELLDLVAQYVPDMRLLKNVRNEFIVFRDQIISGGGKQLDLNESGLFAMMLYKNTHLTDFESIRLGASKLDDLYRISRELVAANLKKLERECSDRYYQLERMKVMEKRSARLGDLLLAHIERTAISASPLGKRVANKISLSYDSSPISDAHLCSVDFWKSFTSADGNPVITQQMTTGHGLEFSRSSLSSALDDPLDAKSWDETDLEAWAEQIDRKQAEMVFLRSADFDDLVDNPKFLVLLEEDEQSFQEIARDRLGPGLAYELVRSGYVDRNFTLYTSIFHGDRVSAAAMNFIIHHVDRDQMDEYFELSADDVDAVIRERGNALGEPSLYKIAVLDHLLTADVDKADVVIRSLVGFGERQKEFFGAYLAAGEQRLKFVERFESFSPQALVRLVSQDNLDDASLLELTNSALNNLTETKQQTSDALSEYLASNYTQFTSLTSNTTAEQAERIGLVFTDANITVPRLKPLSPQVCLSFVSRNLYQITHENLTIAIDNPETVALDAISLANPTVYEYVLSKLPDYLDSIGKSATVNKNDQFITVIENVLEHDASHCGDVVKFAGRNCKISDLEEVSKWAWSALAADRRFPATFNNVSRYFDVYGFIDVYLANLLVDAKTITDVDGADETQKVQLAVALLAAKEHIPSSTMRVGLVACLNLGTYLDVSSVEPEQGEFFALLLSNDIIDDDVKSYERLKSMDWVTKRAFIQESKKFKSYMKPELVRPDLKAILDDETIDSEIKEVIVEQAADYSEGLEDESLRSLARFAIKRKSTLPDEVIQRLAQISNYPRHDIVQLLEPQLETIGLDQLLTILGTMGGEYKKLTEKGRERPKISNTEADQALLERLAREGIVSPYHSSGEITKVNKKQK
ncbi:MAG: DNA-binding protein [Propionibacteriaceae bacterium]|nr:DNA-binding protein [Propionibacteriaceae bacterium]